MGLYGNLGIMAGTLWGLIEFSWSFHGRHLTRRLSNMKGWLSHYRYYTRSLRIYSPRDSSSLFFFLEIV